MPSPNASTSSSSETPVGPLAAEQRAQEVLARQAQLAGGAVERRERGALRALDARRPLARRARIGDRARAEPAPAEREVDRDEQRRPRRSRPARATARRAPTLPLVDGDPYRPRPPDAARTHERRAGGEQRDQRRDEKRAAEGLRRAAVELARRARRAARRRRGRSAADTLTARERRVEVGQLLVAGLRDLGVQRPREVDLRRQRQRRVEHVREPGALGRRRARSPDRR